MTSTQTYPQGSSALASPSHHGDAVSRDVDWTREDSVAIIGSVASLVTHSIHQAGT